MNISLEDYGFEPFFKKQIEGKENLYSLYGRVISVHKAEYEIVTKEGMQKAMIPGVWKRKKNPLDRPAVGDWVFFERKEGKNIINRLFERKNILSRKKRHWNQERPIAANLDKVFIIQSFGQDIHFRRLERMLLYLRDAHIPAHIIFHKSDRVNEEEKQKVISKFQSLSLQTPFLVTSIKTGEGMDDFSRLLEEKKTYAFLGSSGVGKSSLVNVLAGEDIFSTNGLTKVGKGKHTTTARRLVRIPNAALIVDTPGTREFSIDDREEESIKKNFPLIDAYASACKFRNCKHRKEPGCAVKKAVEEGKIDRAMYEDYLSLMEEINKEEKNR